MEDRILDKIYDNFDTLMRNGEFKEIDRILDRIQPEDYSSTLLIGYLTITGAAKSKLESRPALFDRIKKHLDDMGRNEPGLLDGLE